MQRIGHNLGMGVVTQPGETISVVVNGAACERRVQPGLSLLELLREELGLTGAKYGCGEGECGACTVLVDGRPERSCIMPAAAAGGRSVQSVEGLAAGGRPHPVQAAFAEAGAAQCGYCTPGMVMAAVALLDRTPHPDDAEIVAAMNGNICRCGGYPRIVAAIHRASERKAAAGPLEPDDPAPENLEGIPWDLQSAEERGYFDALGDGLVAVLPADPPERSWAPGSVGGGAWLHVGGDGRVTLFTGKVSVGQGTRAALALLAAEELGIPPHRVRVVMGDTDMCPFDLGTFGSRGMPVAGRATRLVAAGAREALQALAGGGRVDAESLHDLLGGRRLVELVGSGTRPAPPARWTVAGREHADPATWDAVTGARRFTTDIVRDGMLQGRVLRPPALGAELVSADLSEVEAVEGAVGVHEDGLAGAVAPSFREATLALERVRARWAETPQPPGAELAEHLRSHPVEIDGWGGAEEQRDGDPDGAMAAAASTLAETYTTAYIAHTPLETRAAVAEWAGGRLTVWVGSQRPFEIRRVLALELGLDEASVRVIVPDTGAGFGGKHTPEVALSAARMARAAQRPVKVRWTREEEFRWGYFRPAAVIDVASGVDAGGRLSAWTLVNINSGSAAIGCPYDVPNQWIRFQPADSPLPQGAYRSLAAVANTFARESHVDRVARGLERDAVEYRLAHLSDDRLRAVLEAAADRAGWPDPAPGRGLGIAASVEKGGYVATCAEVDPAAAGGWRVTRIVTAFECGAIVHPWNLRAQVEGATVMGLGGALFEAVRFDRGRVLNASLAEYRVPRFSDVPPIEVVLLDRPDIEPAGGGETPITAVAPAIANALAAAGGGQLNALPLRVTPVT
jgi:isoquinoline 1-oxidoreductase